MLPTKKNQVMEMKTCHFYAIFFKKLRIISQLILYVWLLRLGMRVTCLLWTYPRHVKFLLRNLLMFPYGF